MKIKLKLFFYVKTNKCLVQISCVLEEFSRSIFLLIHRGIAKSEAIYPKTKIFGEKNQFSKIPAGDARKTKMAARFGPSRCFSQLSWKVCTWAKKLWEPFLKSISWATICTLSELCSSFGSGVITWNVSILGVARSAAHRSFQFSTFFNGLGTFCLSEAR